MKIVEPIHFAGPSPGDQSGKSEKKNIRSSPPVTDQDDPLGAAQQAPPEEIKAPVQRPIEEEVKEPEPPQTVELA